MESGRLTALSTALPTVLLLSSLCGTGLAAQQKQANRELGCDPSAIQWFIPGQFEEALARAKAENRLLVIKGISFGVDEAGAKCATKGKW